MFDCIGLNQTYKSKLNFIKFWFINNRYVGQLG